MIQVRIGVFETNSSSTHAVCIATRGELDIPDRLHFDADWFGRSPRPPFLDVAERACYLWSCILTGTYKEKKAEVSRHQNFIYSTLAKRGCLATFNTEDEGWVEDYNVSARLVAYVTKSEKHLLHYLFNPLSFVLVGGDEYEECYDYPDMIKMPYPHDEIV